MSENEQRYFQARVREKKGYMALDFEKIVSDTNVVDNVYLEDEDSLYVPPKKIFVNVQGRVNNPGLIVYKADYNYMDYITLAGGYGFRADEGETMIVKSKGEQFNAESFDYTIEPGDNILVPPEKEVSGWTVLSEGLTIAVQLASIVGLVVSLMALSRN
jgi:polysaccharide export outer membrane protein